MRKAVVVLLLLGGLLSGCVMSTTVTIDSDPRGAEVYVDNRKIGQTPVTTRMSNGIWEDPSIRLEKEGYSAVYGSLNKDIKPVNLVVGLVLWWPSLLWVYGPESYQHFYLPAE